MTSMTMPVERTRNLIQAGAFLRDLEANSKLPREVRTEASRLLRHFPSVSDVQAIASNESLLLQVTKSRLLQTYLVAECDPAWLQGYSHGPHIGG
ncbi:BPSL0761 family protein [Xanthomonas arboricola]